MFGLGLPHFIKLVLVHRALGVEFVEVFWGRAQASRAHRVSVVFTFGKESTDGLLVLLLQPGFELRDRRFDHTIFFVGCFAVGLKAAPLVEMKKSPPHLKKPDGALNGARTNRVGVFFLEFLPVGFR